LSVVLQNVVSPLMAGTISYPQQNMPTGEIDLMEGSTVVGTGTIANGNRLTYITIPSITAGTHTYTAQYKGDSNYAALSFGSFTVVASSTAPVAGTVQLVTTAVLSKRSDGTYQANVVITNKGTGVAQNVTLTSATLGAAAGTPMPLAVGNVAPSGSTTAVVTFPASAGTSGAAAVEKYSGSYSGGTFGGSIRASLP
jgi:hypothetical protein